MSLTYNPKKRKRQKKHGFRARQKTQKSRIVLTKRRRKGRYKIAI